MTVNPETMLSHALAYARRGWPVFPCQPGTKQPATRHGFHDATTDPARITQWWHRRPDANLAIATGTPGPDVLDIDQHGPAGNGFTAYRKLSKAGLIPSPNAVVATPNGGLHLYFTGTSQRTGRLPRHHIDFRAAGGCILAPPSQVGDRNYRFIGNRTGISSLNWDAVTMMLEPQRDRPASTDRPASLNTTALTAWVEHLQPGNRNSGLFWAACRVIEARHYSLLDDLAAAAASTGLPQQEITRTITSARKAAQPNPSTQRNTDL